MQRFLVFMAMGMEIGFLIYGAFLLGEILDKTYHSKGLIFVVMAFLVLIGWMIQVFWMIRKIQKEDEKNESSQ